MEIERTLRPIASSTPLLWKRGCGTDEGGTLHLAATYCGLKPVPEIFPGV